MVDLHQSEPGLAEGHPWLELGRWGMAWRSALACAVAGAAITGVLVLLGLLGNDPPGGIAASNGLLLAGVVPLAAAASAAVFGPWLRRYYPFSQGLLFGGLTVAVLGLVVTVWGLVDVIGTTCPPDELCAGPLDPAFLLLFLFGLPAFLTACAGYQLAIGFARLVRRPQPQL